MSVWARRIAAVVALAVLAQGLFPALTTPVGGVGVGPAGVAGAARESTAAAFPVPAGAWFGRGHHDYPATDLMAPCGRRVVAPVAGTVDEVSRVDRWRRSVNDPATRGGRFVSIVGDDGVRYYLAHLRGVEPGVLVGSRVVAGQRIGSVGRSGRAGACHVHFGISPPCPQSGEWWVRRGVVSPYDVLRAWKRRESASSAPAVAAWAAAHPDACTGPEAVGAQ